MDQYRVEDGSPVSRAFEAVAFGEGRQAYHRWREEALAAQLFEVAADTKTFRNDMRRWWFGDVPVTAYTQSGASYARSPERARSDGVDALWVQTVDTGAVHGLSAGNAVHVAAGMSALCDLGRVVEQRTDPGEGWIIVLPRDAFARAALDGLHGATASGVRHRMLSDHLKWLAEAPEPGAGLDERRLSVATAAVVTACLSPHDAVPEAATPALVRATLRRAIVHIDQRLSEESLDVAEVARAVGVSRASLYRACEGAGGVSALIWERRLQAVRAALSDPQRTGRVGAIAAEFGFASASHFASRFKDRFGFSPRNLRPF